MSKFTDSSSSAIPGKCQERVDPVSFDEFPQRTSNWKRKHLDRLRIVPCSWHCCCSPLDVVIDGYFAFKTSQSLSAYTKWKSSDEVDEMRECLKSFFEEGLILDRELESEVSFEALEQMKISMKRWRRHCMRRLKMDKVEEMCLKAEHSGQEFVEHLAYMKSLQSRQEGLYQELVKLYLKIFSLKVVNSPCVGSQNLQIGTKVLASQPDILVLSARNMTNVKVVSVIKMRRNNSIADTLCERTLPSNRKRQKLEECDTARGNVSQLDDCDTARGNVSELDDCDAFIGQHGGDLVSHLPLSLFREKGIFGMTVQNTKVSISYLAADEDYMKNLENGCLGNKMAQLQISAESNILSKKGRDNLFKAIFEIFLLQQFYE